MYTSFEPNTALKPYVASFFSLDFERGDKERIDEICLPFGCGIMGFQFKGRCKILIENQTITTNRFYTTGQQTVKYQMISDNPVLSIAGAAFHATGLWHLFRLNMPALVMTEVDTRRLFYDDLQQFKVQFAATRTKDERVQLIEGLLLDSLKNATPIPNMVDIAVDLIHEDHGCCQMKNIVAKLNVSQGYFEKRFKKMVGISPSVYCRIIRFNYLFSALEQKKKLDYKALSILFNYYDFPHFSKDFKRFSGKSPSKFHLTQFNLINDYMVKNPLVVRKVYST